MGIDEPTRPRTKGPPGATKDATRLSLFVFPEGAPAFAVQVPDRGTLLLGRGAEAGAILDHDSVSRVHARLQVGTGVQVEDLGSTNGTRVGGHRLEPNQPVALPLGAVLEIGDVVCMLRSAATQLPAPQTKRTGAPVTHGAVFEDESMRELYGLLDLIGPSDINVLILGETGVGKDVFASALHDCSPRSKGSFVRINCAALPESMLEAELFGYEKGAFTGALQNKEGLFEAADQGSVFLDEIGEVPLPVQAKLLRVVENREVTRLGSVRPRKVDCRIMSATNRDLEALSATGQFRSDLYFRLAGASVLIPPLRRRPADLRPLAAHFLKKTQSPPVLSAEVLARLAEHRWPGNVRELRAVIERAAMLARGKPIEPTHLRFGGASLNEGAPASVRTHVAPVSASPGAGTVREAVRDVERERILQTLTECHGNNSEAARRLGISRTTLLKRLAEYGHKG